MDEQTPNRPVLRKTAVQLSFFKKHFQQQVKRTPNKAAVFFEDKVLTYQALNTLSNQLAHFLTAHHIQCGEQVVIRLQRSERLLVTLIALLKLGITYIPLDVSYPKERIHIILDDIKPKAIISESNLSPLFEQKNAHLIYIDKYWQSLSHYQIDEIEMQLEPDTLAYILYTSGSTGKPKGVEISQQALANFLIAMQDSQLLEKNDFLLAITTISFDIAHLELLLPLVTGASVEIATHKTATNGYLLKQKLSDQPQISIMQATPTTWRLLIDSGWQGNKQLKVLCGGEALTEDLRDQLLPRCHSLWNLYGPTEATIWTTIKKIETNEPITIGKPIANMQVLILNQSLLAVAMGEIGEIYIGGPGLAQGYHQRNALTQKSFIENPFDQGRSKLYRTGDLGKYLPNGDIVFIGRTDSQVKVRGFRIELGEIENILLQHPVIKNAAVTVREDIPGDQRIIAYVILNNHKTLNVRDIRVLLLERLPHYMQPSHFVVLAAFPLTANFKIDRNALPPPNQADSDVHPKAHGFKTPLQKSLAEIWQKYLHCGKITAKDNFFDLGGHSLLATKVIAEIHNKYNLTLSVQTLIYNTLEQIVANFEGDKSIEGGIDVNLQVFYFTNNRSRLFGCLSLNNSVQQSTHHILICYPFGQEYIRTHRAFRVLANRLAQCGFPTLRFDYSGCGDSYGKFEDTNLSLWISNIRSSINQIAMKTHLKKVVVIAPRFSAYLAIQATQVLPIETLILWDPIVNGQDYLAELGHSQNTTLSQLRRKIEPGADTLTNALGYPLTPALRREMAKVDLLSSQAKPCCKKMLMVYSNPNYVDQNLQHYLQEKQCNVEYLALNNKAPWYEEPDAGLVPVKTIKAITDWLTLTTGISNKKLIEQIRL